jgi:NAD(P)-dependent dehydrogenase (short-subunit alcohol dehydrogenase family)
MVQSVEELFALRGRTALVTGGSKGLGKAMARALALAGADVVISARHAEDLRRALPEILDGTQAKGEWIVADLTRREEAVRLAEEALRRMGRVDILVNNAGTNIPQPIQQMEDEAWDCIVELNLSSCMALMRALAPQMMERRWGRIINISSIMGFVSAPGRGAYSATKAGLIGLTHACALDLGPYGITVNCIAPGPFLTDLPRSLLTPEQQKLFAQRTALGRWGEPQELMGAVLLLASDAGSYITGSVLVVDGGWLAR